MKRSQIQVLNQAGNDFMLRSRRAESNKEAIKLSEIGMKMLAEARTVLDSCRRNSVILYLEISLATSHKPTYTSFLTFCARNNLEIISKTDFQAVSDSILPLV